MILVLTVFNIRYYSIASSPDYTRMASTAGTNNLTLDILLTVLEYKTDGMQGVKRKGFCSNYLADANIGASIVLFLKPSNFHLPSTPTNGQPILLIGAGAGIAPFRGFWQQLMLNSIKESNEMEVVQQMEMLGFNDAKAQDTASEGFDEYSETIKEKVVTLFFGCRNKQCNLLEDETKVYSKIMSRLNAFSRESNLPKQYVSDVMQKAHQSIYHSLVEQNGLVYVCGKISMANSVFKTLVTIVAEQLIQQNVINNPDSANITAEDFINSLIDEGRYHQDIFGADDI